MATSKKKKKDIAKTSPELRAFSKVQRRKPQIVSIAPITSFMPSASVGSILFSYMTPSKGVLQKPTICVQESSHKQFTISITVVSGDSEHKTDFTIGTGIHSVDDINVSAGDILTVTLTDKKDTIKLRNIYVAFNFIQGG